MSLYEDEESASSSPRVTIIHLSDQYKGEKAKKKKSSTATKAGIGISGLAMLMLLGQLFGGASAASAAAAGNPNIVNGVDVSTTQAGAQSVTDKLINKVTNNQSDTYSKIIFDLQNKTGLDLSQLNQGSDIYPVTVLPEQQQQEVATFNATEPEAPPPTVTETPITVGGGGGGNNEVFHALEPVSGNTGSSGSSTGTTGEVLLARNLGEPIESSITTTPSESTPEQDQALIEMTSPVTLMVGLRTGSFRMEV